MISLELDKCHNIAVQAWLAVLGEQITVVTLLVGYFRLCFFLVSEVTVYELGEFYPSMDPD